LLILFALGFLSIYFLFEQRHWGGVVNELVELFTDTMNFVMVLNKINLRIFC